MLKAEELKIEINKILSYLNFELKIAIRAYDSLPIAVFIIIITYLSTPFFLHRQMLPILP